jgi:arylsulfatase A-like enzyme
MILRAIALSFFAGLSSAAVAADSPNIILLLSDDQGWTGTSLQMDERVANSRSDLYRTPNLERLAAQGMRFSNAYSPAPNCSPTRMSIQTGKTAARLGATDIIDVVPNENGVAGIQAFYDDFYVNKPLIVPLPVANLPDDETTIAEFLKAHDPDYIAGHFGKWHMGGGSPERHGYDEHDGLTTNNPGRQGPPDPKRTREITDRSLEFLNAYGDGERPILLQVSYYAVHTPVLAMPEDIERYKGYSSNIHLNTAYGAMTEDLDRSVGAILDKLDELGIADNTYVIYTSDNGGESDNPVTNNIPLALGKTHVWEGGIRVPLVVRGPGIAGSTHSHVPAIGYDLLPTIAEWVGASDSLPTDIDGGSLAGVLANGGDGVVDRGTDALIWYYGAYRNMKHVGPQAAIRQGNFKLVREFDSGREYLFDLDLDLSETTDLSPFRVDVAKALSHRLDAYFEAVRLELPTRNPNYDPTRDTGLISVSPVR